MPITARLSKKFYDRLGEDIVNELVGLLNLIDSTYRSELKEINEINFARFEAKLEQRIDSLRSELKSDMAELKADMAGLKATLEQRLGEQTRWYFVAWAALLIPIIGLWFR
jgi:hypothetical protein